MTIMCASVDVISLLHRNFHDIVAAVFYCSIFFQRVYMKKLLHSLVLIGVTFLTSNDTHTIRFDMGYDDHRLAYDNIEPDAAIGIIKNYIHLWTDLVKNPENVSKALQDFEERMCIADEGNILWHLDYACAIIEKIRTEHSAADDQMDQYMQGRMGFIKILKLIPVIAMIEAKLKAQADDEIDEDSEQESF